MLKMIAIGNLTGDPVLKTNEETGKPYAIMRIASDRRYKSPDGEKLTDFISIKVRGQLAERCVEFARKGCKIAASGDFETITFAEEPERQPGFLLKAIWRATALGDMTRTSMQAATKTEHLSRNRRGDRMRICIEESTYEGTPIEILTQLRAMHFDADTFDGTEGYIRYMQNTIRRMTEQPCELPEGSTEKRAAALIHVLHEVGALELLEES